MKARARDIIVVAALATMLVSACAAPPPLAFGPDVERQIDALVAAAMAQREIPGLALVVMHRDEVVLARGYGRESATRPDPVTPQTVFLHNSVGKHFTAAMVLALAEDGQWGLDDPVIKHLPDFRLLPPTLTVRHVLNQSSGVREAAAIPALWDLFEKADATRAQARAALRTAPVDWKPGSRWSYSNTNYALLQALVEQKSGTPLSALYAERFFRPHKLASMRVCPFLVDDVQGHAVGYADRGTPLVRAGGVNNEVSLGPGGLCGSALDLARWQRLLATGRIVSARSYEQMTTPAQLDGGAYADYGFGLGLMQQDGVRRAGHSGIGFGYSSTSAYYPDAELTITVLANRFGYPDALERQVARRLLQRPEPDRRDVGITPAQRRMWAGTYDVGMFGLTPKFFDRDGRLWFELFGPSTTYPLILTRHGVAHPETIPDAMQFRFTQTPSGVRLQMQTFGTQDWSGFRREAQD